MQIIEVGSDRVNIGDIGFSQENNDAQLHIELPEKLLGFDSYDVEFELEKGDKSVLKNVEIKDNIVVVPLYQNVLEFGKLYFQIVAYNFDVDQKSKSNLYFGHVQRSINATETIEIVPEVVDQIYKEILILKEEISSIDGMNEEEVYDLIKRYLKENPIEGILSEDEKEDFIKNTESRHTHDNLDTLDLFESFTDTLDGDEYAMPYFDGRPIWTNDYGGLVTSITQNSTTGETKINLREYANFSQPIKEYTITTPTKTSDLENDSGFITKADIPTDESYELLGSTPLTLDETSNIKLVAEGETTYSIETPTVWNFDNVTPTLSNCAMSTDKGYYELTATGELTGYYQSYMAFVISGLEIGKTYKLICNSNGLTVDITQRIHRGTIAIWSGTSTAGTSLVSGHDLNFNENPEFTATEESVYIRYYPARNSAPFAGWVANFNNLYLNYADTTEELTGIYSKSGAFTDVVTFKAIPNGATITTEPTASVYRKAPTDKTLTQSDVPADAKVTGEKIAEVKSYLPLYRKTIVNFGDSIFGNAQPPNDISTFLAEKTGATVYNCGFGGCRMSVHPTSEYNAFSMYSLANSIASGDYTTQETALESTEVTLPARFAPSVERLKGIDFSKVDIVTIAYGTNDFNGYGVNLDNEENALDINTFGGALRHSIETLLTAYPNLKIFVLSIAYRFYIDENNEYVDDTNNHANNYGKYAMDYNAKLKEVAEEYNLPYVDDYNIGIGKFNRYQYFNATDGAHHKEEGRRLIAEHLASALTTGHSNGANNVPIESGITVTDDGNGNVTIV